MKLKSYTLLFSVTILVLTALGLALFYYRVVDPPFWFGFAYIIAWVLLLALADDFFASGGWWSRKELLLLTFWVIVLSFAATHSVFTVISPRWFFSVCTDKSDYKLGENVQITVSLENLGLIAHSFKSSLRDPVVVSVEFVHDNPTVTTQVWYSPFHFDTTQFVVAPNQFLERTFIWNQTWTINLWLQNQTYMPGTYSVEAFIPRSTSELLGYNNLFRAWTSINITST